ncbi:MAG: fenitrothion hydrolase [Thermoleophilaceae bacterium]|nr:fenitrothion hydrolase [Thermoleophilaceae bacterium]
MALGAALLLPAQAFAHGLVGRSDLPIPEWLFGWAAAVVLAVSFVALAVLWPKPRLQEEGWRPFENPLARAIVSPPAQIGYGAIGVFLFLLVVVAGLAGTDVQTENLAPTFIYVFFWVGLVLVSALLGDVFRAFNPWRAIGRAVGYAAETIAPNLPAPLTYPERLGHWPAVAGIAGFAFLELVLGSGNDPQALALAAIIYSAVQFVAMALYGVEPWIARGEAFSVYFNLFSRISPLEAREGRLGRRRFLSGLPALPVLPGTVALVAVMIGSTTFDGLSEGSFFQSIFPTLQDFFTGIGFSISGAGEGAFFVGLVVCVAVVAGFYRLGVIGARSVGGNLEVGDLARAFVHSLVPIAFAYVIAHYASLLINNGQGIVPLASDPLGNGSDYFGTAEKTIDYGYISATAFWYIQVGVVVLGHVAALVLAHDRALTLYDKPRIAVRSQYWLLMVMVGFTTLALWLLSQANTA